MLCNRSSSSPETFPVIAPQVSYTLVLLLLPGNDTIVHSVNGTLEERGSGRKWRGEPDNNVFRIHTIHMGAERRRRGTRRDWVNCERKDDHPRPWQLFHLSNFIRNFSLLVRILGANPNVHLVYLLEKRIIQLHPWRWHGSFARRVILCGNIEKRTCTCRPLLIFTARKLISWNTSPSFAKLLRVLEAREWDAN